MVILFANKDNGLSEIQLIISIISFSSIHIQLCAITSGSAKNRLLYASIVSLRNEILSVKHCIEFTTFSKCVSRHKLLIYTISVAISLEIIFLLFSIFNKNSKYSRNKLDVSTPVFASITLSNLSDNTTNTA